MSSLDLAKKKEVIRRFIRSNPQATYLAIKHATKLKIERIYCNMGEAFKDAGVEPPRTFGRRNIEERKAIIVHYIQQHPRAGGQTIAKDVKIPVCGVFKTTKEAFDAAGIPYPREIDKQLREEKKIAIIDHVKENPSATNLEIQTKFHTHINRLFTSVYQLRKRAKIQFIRLPKKQSGERKTRKQEIVIDFIKDNPKATQREINKQCNTKVQELFTKGILGAYEKAGVPYPTERLQIYGVANKEIRKRSQQYENKIATKLSQFGKVSRLVKMRKGIADIVLESKRKKVIVEVKDYRSHQICKSQIKQLYKYLELSNHHLGILVCPKKPKRDVFVIDNKKLFVVQDNHLNDVLYFMNKYG